MDLPLHNREPAAPAPFAIEQDTTTVPHTVGLCTCTSPINYQHAAQLTRALSRAEESRREHRQYSLLLFGVSQVLRGQQPGARWTQLFVIAVHQTAVRSGCTRIQQQAAEVLNAGSEPWRLQQDDSGRPRTTMYARE